MANMRILIRIVFVIFIANVTDCLGSNNCCNFPKYENIIKDENITAESLVNEDWYNVKKNNLVLKILKKENDNVFTSEGNEDKLNENDNTKITDQNEAVDPLKLGGKKYALFEIKTQEENMIYLYCSDVESRRHDKEVLGIFQGTDHISISVIACDTEKVTDMNCMFYGCSSLKEINFGKNFNTKNVTDMRSMFSGCSKLTKLEFGEKFNPSHVTDMGFMFSGCNSLTKIEFGQNFNTSNVTDMAYMFYECSSLTKIEFGQNFNTSNVTVMKRMFFGCSSLNELEFGQNFNTSNVTDMNSMFCGCSSLTEIDLNNFDTTNVTDIDNIFENCKKLSEEKRSKILNKNQITTK